MLNVRYGVVIFKSNNYYQQEITKESLKLQFSKLRLSGFKSFVDPTELIIKDGLTGVVGPNGCGKSNLLEALRWVMGENRPTAMRGGGMEDVIFAGAATRPARNFAEVALHLDNSERAAPSIFNNEDNLEIVRRITREAGSAYKSNGQDVRARDVQMLFADASTGAHSPALVRQGQIAELINAKPKSRRRVLEEAAGISGLYQRRHEAELKLNAAETNLVRVEDVLDQLANQLGQLARQAKQAARYRVLGEQLREVEGTLLYCRWRDADKANFDADNALIAHTKIAAEAEALVAKAKRVREIASENVPPLREEASVISAMLQRLIVEQETLEEQERQAKNRIETLSSRIEQLGQDIDREDSLNNDALETIKILSKEQEALKVSLSSHEEELETASSEVQEAATILNDKEINLSELTEDMARLAARHQSLERFLLDSQNALNKNNQEVANIDKKVNEALVELERMEKLVADVVIEEKSAKEHASKCEEQLLQLEEKRFSLQSNEEAANLERSEVEGEAKAIRAEFMALEKLIEKNSNKKSHIIDEVRVEVGFEKAFGAALADDLRAPISSEKNETGWVKLNEYSSVKNQLPRGIKFLTDVVEIPTVLSRRLKYVGLVDREQGDSLHELLQPGQRLVSLEGDLWRWDGFKIWAGDMPSAAALQIQQVNTLEDLDSQLGVLEKKLGTARVKHEDLVAKLLKVSEQEKTARLARRDADQVVNDAVKKLNKVESDKSLIQAQLENYQISKRRYEEEAQLSKKQVASANKSFVELEDLNAMRSQVEEVKLNVEAARVTMMTKRSLHDEVRREGEIQLKRAQELQKEISGWSHRLDTAEKRISELIDRKNSSQWELEEASKTPSKIKEKRKNLVLAISETEKKKAEADDSLSLAETKLNTVLKEEREAERVASEAREDRARCDAKSDAARQNLQLASDRIREALGLSVESLLEEFQLDGENLPSADTLETKVGQIKRQREALGSVNLRAEDDAKEVSEEHEKLFAEKADLEQAIKTLRTGIASLNSEGRERLLTAFEQVNSNFSMLFKHLFGGGEANLEFVESDDPLEAGLEIMCQPPGKKLAVLSLLSGGEQTLTALALIFAVFLANPAPICVLDEVDAPLDDANVSRFCELLDEMCRQTDTRFMIITHHAITMSRMDRLFGVTMQEQGVSQLVSVDLKKAESLVA